MTTCINKVFGERVALNNVKEPPRDGEILLPETAHHDFRIGDVVAVGDMEVDGKKADAVAEVGDLVMYQFNKMQHDNNRYNLGKEHVILLHQGDLIARLKDRHMTLEAFEPLGKWVLISYKQWKNSSLFIPQNAAATEMPETFSFHVEKCGSACGRELNPGDEVVLERNRCNQIKIDGETFLFISVDFIYAVTSPDREGQTEATEEDKRGGLIVTP